LPWNFSFSSNYFFGLVGINGTSADTNIELALGGDDSRGVNKALLATIVTVPMSGRLARLMRLNNLFVASLRRGNAS